MQNKSPLNVEMHKKHSTYTKYTASSETKKMSIFTANDSSHTRHWETKGEQGRAEWMIWHWLQNGKMPENTLNVSCTVIFLFISCSHFLAVAFQECVHLKVACAGSACKQCDRFFCVVKWQASWKKWFYKHILTCCAYVRQ